MIDRLIDFTVHYCATFQKVEERVQNIMAEWKQGANFSKVNQLLNQEVDKLTNHQLYELIELFASVRHIANRFERLGTSAYTS